MFYGAFDVVVEAETEEERDRLLDELAVWLSLKNDELSIHGFEDTEKKWAEDEDCDCPDCNDGVCSCGEVVDNGEVEILSGKLIDPNYPRQCDNCNNAMTEQRYLENAGTCSKCRRNEG